MSNREPIKIMADIIRSEMDLREDQILLAYQKFEIPKNKDLFVTLSYLDTSFVSVQDESVGVDSSVGMIEYQTVTIRNIIQIDILSYGDEARTRKEEILMALRSVYSEQQQTAYNIQIARNPISFNNVSVLEETAFLNRFTIAIACTSTQQKTKVPPYFDTFDTPEVIANA